MEKGREGWIVVRIASVEPTPPILSLQIGDAAHNLRSALDHLLFRLAKPTTVWEERNVQFPLVNAQRDFAKTKRNMPGVARGVRTTVEMFQPYHHQSWPETALLGQLQAINNWGKHRSLMATVAAVQGSRILVRVSDSYTLVQQEFFPFHGPLKPGEIVTRFGMVESVIRVAGEVHPELTLTMVFDDKLPKAVRGAPVIATLESVGQFIEYGLLPKFERFLLP